MKKKLGYLFLTITIVVLMLYVFRYKRPLVIENRIPISATEIVHIDLRQIEHHLLVDAVKNPFKYISFESKKEKNTPSFNKTIEIPRNLFFFTNKSNFKAAWFSNTIKITDSTEFKKFLLQKGFEKSTDKKLELFSKGKVVIAVSGEDVLMVYKEQQDISVNTVIQSIFKETNFCKKDHDLLKLISNSKSDISYTNLDSDFFEGDFKKGFFEIRGNVHSNLFITDTYSEYSKNSVGFLATKINRYHKLFKSLLSDKNKRKFNQFTKLSVDSIVNNWNGSLVLGLKAVNTKIDTIVTYEYDDDFNKIEKKSIQELKIPDATIALGSDASLYEYFYTHKAVQILEKDTLFVSIPLYKMYAQRQENSLNIFTLKHFDNSLLKEKKYKLNAYLDIKKYLENPLEFSLIPVKNDYFKQLDKASVNLTTHDELLIQVSLKENNRNFLGQLIKP